MKKERTFIITDLSDVLVNGLYHIADRIIEMEAPGCIERYGEIEGRARAEEIGQWVWDQILTTADEFKDLLRGKILEDEYWDATFDNNDKVIEQVKAAFSANLKLSVPGTLKVFQRIIAFPSNLSAALANSRDLSAEDFTSGMPDIVLLSDHITERIHEVKLDHPEVCRILSGEFWSCDIGMVKSDPGCFERVLKDLDSSPANIIFIDDQRANVIAAESAGLHGIVFHNARQLETILKETYHFQIAPELP